MRLLFELDAKNYDGSEKQFVRPSVRGILIEGGKIAMVHSLKYDYYKFPGGGSRRARISWTPSNGRWPKKPAS